MQHTYTQYGQKCRTGSWFRETGGCVISQKRCVNLDPLGYLVSIDTPNMAQKAEQEVGFAKQEVASYLGNDAS